ncbi:TetR/AcrR family transcriptional regulator [Nocardiopsis sp. MG754419]|uniref:TetR/AcrR family transcriptional regulator n=1 Tax=Nocardiopsis sp. MG754419 TaxID=2259865 RepID=UPI001BA6E5F0|nr:TetR family transcriptional regulator [Nocardiopsis sp. MG754419]MBR8742294.1 TetR family transcriptional regulator [Nocardiopsis sp. MG754419]
MGGSRRVANDPGRKERIVVATLEVVAERGVHKTTHRAIAERASVPLGSLTYYFDGLTEILEHAFRHLTHTMSEYYGARVAAAADRDEACAAVVDLICGPEYATPRQFVLLFEMYSYANHNDEVRRAARAWMDLSRSSLSAHFSPGACRALDALVEGWSMHRHFEREEGGADRALVAATVAAIAGRLD